MKISPPTKSVNYSKAMVKKSTLLNHVGEDKELAVKYKALRKELLQEKTKNEKLQQKIAKKESTAQPMQTKMVSVTSTHVDTKEGMIQFKLHLHT